MCVGGSEDRLMKLHLVCIELLIFSYSMWDKSKTESTGHFLPAIGVIVLESYFVEIIVMP